MLSANEKRILKNYRGIGENGDATAGLPPRQAERMFYFQTFRKNFSMKQLKFL